MKRIKRVFVANRGEIAVRIVARVPGAGLETVVGASEVDRDGLAARRADRAVCIGPAPAAESYLRDDAGRAGRARHRLRRDPSRLRLPVREPEAGVAGAGARAHVRRAAGRGDRAERRQAARPRGGRARRCARPARPGGAVGLGRRGAADEIGYPLLVKAAGGGGGRGIKLARDGDELDGIARAWPAARRARRSATSACTSSGSSPPPATSRCRSPPTSTARSFTSASATARCSAATRR